MPAEWKRANWTYDAVGLGHTNITIMNAMEAMLVACGWERAPWDTAIDRFFLRTDRRTVVLTNDGVGVVGNVAITKVDPDSRITVSGMSGGSSLLPAAGAVALNMLDVFDGNSVTIGDGTNPPVVFQFDAGIAAARGKIGFLAQPADGNTVVLTDGVNPSVTFEFDSNSSVVATASLKQVVIGASIGVTVSNLSAAINAVIGTLNITANVGPTASVTLTHDTVGVIGNVPITRVGTNIFVEGMTGGGGAVGVTGGATSVPRGSTVEDTIVNLVTAINNAANLNVTAKWQDRWVFNGDGPWQHSGLHIFNDTVNSRIAIRSCLQNASYYGNRISSPTSQQILVAYSNTAPNSFQFYAGEYGFFGECGRDGQKVNLAHWLVATFEPMPELFGTDDSRCRWSSQGIVMDLFGNLKFTADRNVRFSVAASGNRDFTGYLIPLLSRGHNATSFDSPSIGDSASSAIGPMDNVLGVALTYQRDGRYGGMAYALGLAGTPRDGKYRISPMLFRQVWGDWIDIGRDNASASNNLGPDNTSLLWYDIRRWRRVPKMSVTDHTLIPFVNVTDASTGKVYYLTQVQDGGRVANVAIEYTSDVVTIPTSP